MNSFFLKKKIKKKNLKFGEKNENSELMIAIDIFNQSKLLIHSKLQPKKANCL
jgi:hypothetical protein